MSEYITEQEQLEGIKRWFKENGMTLFVVILVGLVAGLAFRQWQYTRERALEHASVRYEQLLTSVAHHDGVSMLRQADYLISRYPHSNYAKLARLLLARVDVDENKNNDAASQLTDVMQTASVPALREIARLRLARLQINEGKAEQALVLLKELDDKNYQAPATEVRGDALLALGKREEARQAYIQALQALPRFEEMRPLLQMKLDNLTSATSDLASSESVSASAAPATAVGGAK